jgi:maltose O-acetyltransferase
MVKSCCLILYYGLFRWMPASTNKYLIIFRLLRRMCVKNIFKYSGIEVNVERGANFGTGVNIELGDYSGIGVNCWLIGPVKIGKYVMMGPEVFLIARNHNFDRIDIPMQLQGADGDKQITIEDDVWIGARAVILPGINIGKGSIIGAGAVVTKNVPAFAIVGGSPARVIRYRNTQ